MFAPFTLRDETLRSAWWRFVRLWRPMAAWTLLVWALIGLILAPLSSFLLGQVVFRGERIIVGNHELPAWLLSPYGISYVVVAGGIAIMGAVVRYAGLFRILTDEVTGRPVSVLQTLFELVPNLTALFRLCVAAVAGAMILLVPLVGGLAGVYFVWLGEYDVNYYFFARPPEWHRALIAASVWMLAWATGAVYVALHSLPALPAFLDGHRPTRVALRRGWRRTRGRAVRVLWLLLLCAGVWLAVRAGIHAAFFFLTARTIDLLAVVADSLLPILVTTATYTAGVIALDALLSFVGFSVVATLLTKLYYEDTDLHAVAPPVPLDLSALPRKIARFVRIWLRPLRALPVLAVLLLGSIGLSAWFLENVPRDQRVVVTAHRAGALLATENTLAALERTIASGAEYAEIDVQATRDGIVVVKHDADMMRLAGDPRRIADVDHAEIAGVILGRDDGIPPAELRLATLDEFLDRAHGRIRLNVELKYYGPDPLLAERVVERVRARGMENEVVIMSLDLNAIRQVQRLAPEIRTGFLASVSLGHLTRLPVDFLAVPLRLATDRLIRDARRRGIEVHVWTLNHATSMLEAIERGVDGIITDDPVLAVRIRDEVAELSAPERLLLRFRPALPPAPE